MSGVWWGCGARRGRDTFHVVGIPHTYVENAYVDFVFVEEIRSFSERLAPAIFSQDSFFQ